MDFLSSVECTARKTDNRCVLIADGLASLVFPFDTT